MGLGATELVRSNGSSARTRVASSGAAVDCLRSSGVHGGVGVLLSMEKGRRRQRGAVVGCCCSSEHGTGDGCREACSSRSNTCTVTQCNLFVCNAVLLNRLVLFWISKLYDG